MTFEELVKAMAISWNTSEAKAAPMLRSLFFVIKGKVMHGDEVAIPGFGRFLKRTTKARVGKGVNAGKQIAESNRIGFRAFGKLSAPVEVERKTA